MNWNTIYITGNDNFWDEVNKKLSQSNLTFLPGFIEQREDGKYQGLYWLDNKAELRKFKEAITGKIIWKYRLHFFTEIEESKRDGNQRPTNEFTAKENALMESMRLRKSKSRKSIKA